MKKVAMLFLCACLGCFVGLASEASSASNSASYTQAPSKSNTTYSPQVCQFSLTSYSGTVDGGGYTGYFQVGLSCPQTEDVRATVVVFIDGEHVASKVITVKAGKDYSDNEIINVGKSYSKQRYNLVVQ